MYPTAEHLFQALKTRNYSMREIMRQMETPGHAKVLGRTLVLREDWEKVKNKIKSFLSSEAL